MFQSLGSSRSHATPSAPVTPEAEDRATGLTAVTLALARGWRPFCDNTVIAATPPRTARTATSLFVSPAATVTVTFSATQSATGSPGKTAVIISLPEGRSTMRNAPSAPLTIGASKLSPPKPPVMGAQRNFTPDSGWPVSPAVTFPSMLAAASSVNLMFCWPEAQASREAATAKEWPRSSINPAALLWTRGATYTWRTV